MSCIVFLLIFVFLFPWLIWFIFSWVTFFIFSCLGLSWVCRFAPDWISSFGFYWFSWRNCGTSLPEGGKIWLKMGCLKDTNEISYFYNATCDTKTKFQSIHARPYHAEGNSGPHSFHMRLIRICIDSCIIDGPSNLFILV